MASQSVNDARLDGLPTELANLIGSYLPAESRAALSLSCKTLEAQNGKAYEGLTGDERKAFLQLLEKDLAHLPLVYCPWCNKMHAPEKSVPRDDTTGRRCQASTWAFDTIKNNTFPAQYHPLLLYGVGKYRIAGRDETELSRALTVDKEVFNYPTYRRERTWNYCLNYFGVFVASQQRLIPKAGSTPVVTEPYCPHNKVTINFKDLLDDDYEVSKSGIKTVCERTYHFCNHGTKQVHGCKQCNRNVHVDFDLFDPENRPAVVTITTWYYLGRGRSPEDIAARQRDPTYRELLEGNTIPQNDVARASEMFRELV